MAQKTITIDGVTAPYRRIYDMTLAQIMQQHIKADLEVYFDVLASYSKALKINNANVGCYGTHISPRGIQYGAEPQQCITEPLTRFLAFNADPQLGLIHALVSSGPLSGPAAYNCDQGVVPKFFMSNRSGTAGYILKSVHDDTACTLVFNTDITLREAMTLGNKALARPEEAPWDELLAKPISEGKVQVVWETPQFVRPALPQDHFGSDARPGHTHEGTVVGYSPSAAFELLEYFLCYFNCPPLTAAEWERVCKEHMSRLRRLRCVNLKPEGLTVPVLRSITREYFS